MQKILKKAAQETTMAIIHFYRAAISPMNPPSCRFYPTCSAYALEAVEKHGAFKGLFLALARISRCHPFHRKSFTDPVPEAFAWADMFRYKRGQDQTPDLTK